MTEQLSLFQGGVDRRECAYVYQKGVLEGQKCDRVRGAMGYCSAHYRRQRRGKDMDAPIRMIGAPEECTHEYPDGTKCHKRYASSGHCGMHRKRKDEGRDLDAPLYAGRGSHVRLPLGTRRKKSNGYITIKVSSDVCGYKDNWMDEHRFVMERVLCRNLEPHEEIHHKNGDKADNHPDNLQLWSHSHPPGQAMADKLQWAAYLIQLNHPGLLTEDQMAALKGVGTLRESGGLVEKP